MIIFLCQHIKEYLDIISPEERRRFMEEFASWAKLSNEEKRLAFGADDAEIKAFVARNFASGESPATFYTVAKGRDLV